MLPPLVEVCGQKSFVQVCDAYPRQAVVQRGLFACKQGAEPGRCNHLKLALPACISCKGQLISKRPYKKSVSSKIPTKLFLGFCPEIFCSFLGASWKLFGLPWDLISLQSGINVGPTFINLRLFSRPYSLIKCPTFIKFWNFPQDLSIYSSLMGFL